MASFHWEMIAEAFSQKYPREGLRLAEVVLEHSGKESTFFSGYRTRAFTILGISANKYPEQFWKKIGEYLKTPLDVRAFTITQWLRGLEGKGALYIFPPEVIWHWVDEDISARAWYLASFVPTELFHNKERMCWAREVLIRYGEREEVRRNLMANLSTESWWGPASLHLEKKKQTLLEFKENEHEVVVRKWVDEYTQIIDQEIEREKIREERNDF